jgi:uncharacterized membrane protein YkgB
MASFSGAGVLLIMGFILVLGALMWDASVGAAWIELDNTSTTSNTDQAAANAGRMFSGGFGFVIVIVGVLLMVFAVISLIMSAVGGR